MWNTAAIEVEGGMEGGLYISNERQLIKKEAAWLGFIIDY